MARRRAAKKPAIRCIGILTSGGDCPGLNATIRGVAKTAIGVYGWEVIGILDGFTGLVENRMIRLDGRELSGLLTVGDHDLIDTPLQQSFRDGNSLNPPLLRRKCVGSLKKSFSIKSNLDVAVAGPVVVTRLQVQKHRLTW